jgi:hypothetical protein
MPPIIALILIRCPNAVPKPAAGSAAISPQAITPQAKLREPSLSPSIGAFLRHPGLQRSHTRGRPLRQR